MCQIDMMGSMMQLARCYGAECGCSPTVAQGSQSYESASVRVVVKNVAVSVLVVFLMGVS